MEKEIGGALIYTSRAKPGKSVTDERRGRLGNGSSPLSWFDWREFSHAGAVSKTPLNGDPDEIEREP